MMFRSSLHIALVSILCFESIFSVFAEQTSLSELEILKNEYTISQTQETKDIAQDIVVPEETHMLIASQKEYATAQNPKAIETLTLTPSVQPRASFGFAHPADVLSSFLGESARDVSSDKKKTRLEKRGGRGFLKNTLAAELDNTTNIQTTDGTRVDVSRLGVGEVVDATLQKAQQYATKKQKNTRNKKAIPPTSDDPGITFEFGIPGTHLIFSRPVKLEVSTPNYSDGVIVDLGVMHAGDTEFHTQGLTTDSTARCQNGIASAPASQAVVKNGKVVFYTCGASSFTMNPSGGTTTSNDVRLVIGDCANIQVYYKGNANIYLNAPATTGCRGNSSWPTLRIGTKTIGSLGTAWNVMSTTGSQVGNTYTAVTTLAATVSGRTYNMTVNWSYVAPNSFFRMDYTLTIPAGNTQNVKFYYGLDSYVNGSDNADVGYYTGGTNPTVGIFDNSANQLLAMKYISGATWAGYEAGSYSNISSRITSGANFNNSIQSSAGDLGFGINWDFGTTPGTYSSSTEWRMLPYVASSVPDLVPSIGQPTPSLVVNQTSQLPIVVTNVGNLASAGTTSIIFTVPTNFSGPTTAFSDNGWSCSATVGVTVTCTKSASIAPLGTDTVNIAIKPLPAAGGTTANFTVNITNSGDSNTTNNSATTALQVAVAPQTQTLWLKADAGTNCTTNGCSLSSWNDQSGLGRNATQNTATSQPLYITNAANFNPAINFNSTAKVLTGPTGGQQTIFAVRNLSVTSGYHMLFASPANADFSIRTRGSFNGTTVMSYTDGPNTGDWPYNTGTPPYFYIDGQQTLIGKNQYHIVRAQSNTVQNNTYSISSTFMNRGMNSDDAVAELMTYNTILSSGTIDIVESYLALKYGITLDQTTPRNYVFSDGTVVWDALGAGSYKNDIAGIARDGTYGLNQIKSQSINNPTDVIVSTGSIINDKRALVWANDGGATNTSVSVSGISGFTRMARAWKVEETNGNLGKIKIAYPNSVISPLYSAPVLIMTTDGTFSTGTTTTTSGSLVGGNWEYIVDIPDGAVFSFGQGGDTVPPVFQSSSLASGTLIPYGNFSVSYTYSDTGSNIDPRSFTAKIYAWNSTLGTWDTTNLAASYVTFNPAPSTTTGTLQLNGLPFGRYRFDVTIADSSGNSTTQSFTYFVDKVEWTISSDEYNIGDIANTVQTFGTGELLVTVKTVGAGFSLSLSPNTSLLTPPSTQISYWNGSLGWGYDLWNGTSYTGNITSHAVPVVLATRTKDINVDGLQNTFTYRLKYGVKTPALQEAGIYIGKVNFGISLNY